MARAAAERTGPLGTTRLTRLPGRGIEGAMQIVSGRRVYEVDVG
jgi:hypothetical protein